MSKDTYDVLKMVEDNLTEDFTVARLNEGVNKVGKAGLHVVGIVVQRRGSQLRKVRRR